MQRSPKLVVDKYKIFSQLKSLFFLLSRVLLLKPEFLSTLLAVKAWIVFKYEQYIWQSSSWPWMAVTLFIILQPIIWWTARLFASTVCACLYKGGRKSFYPSSREYLRKISARFMLLFSIDQPVIQLKRSSCYAMNLALVLSAMHLKGVKLLYRVTKLPSAMFPWCLLISAINNWSARSPRLSFFYYVRKWLERKTIKFSSFSRCCEM